MPGWSQPLGPDDEHVTVVDVPCKGGVVVTDTDTDTDAWVRQKSEPHITETSSSELPVDLKELHFRFREYISYGRNWVKPPGEREKSQVQFSYRRILAAYTELRNQLGFTVGSNDDNFYKEVLLFKLPNHRDIYVPTRFLKVKSHGDLQAYKLEEHLNLVNNIGQDNYLQKEIKNLCKTNPQVVDEDVHRTTAKRVMKGIVNHAAASYKHETGMLKWLVQHLITIVRKLLTLPKNLHSERLPMQTVNQRLNPLIFLPTGRQKETLVKAKIVVEAALSTSN